MSKSSKIFASYRALGYVSNDVPLSLRYILRRKENLVITVVGKSFHTYGCSKLKLLSVSNQHPDEIKCLTSDAYLVFTACKNNIYAWRRGTELKHVYEYCEEVKLLLPFGPHLLAVYENNTLLVWDTKAEVIALEIPFSNFCITTLVHPSTYLNKILFGSYDGTLQLWNLKTNKLIYTYQGWHSPITVLEQSPAIDVVAIGLESGEIFIHNLKFDETIMRFLQDWGPIIAISFRTDGPSIMASSSNIGHIAIWDLEKKKLHSEIRNAHKGSVSGMKFLPNEPLMITSSPDNSLKMWIFDMPDSSGRLLKLKEGHSNPPLKIRFHGSSGKSILSAGLDSTLRSFSTASDNLDKNLGQASYNRNAAKKKGIKYDTAKLSPIIDFTSEITREKEWDNIAAIHRHSALVTTWTYDKCCMGNHKLRHERFKGLKYVEALCIALSSCGNFVLIGYNTGYIDKYNIQSGIYRGSFGKDKAHNGCIRGLVTDGLNQLVISGGSDKLLKFWKFKEGIHLKTLTLEHNVSKMVIHRESALIAVALDNFSVVIIDQETKRIVRIFEDHQGGICDMAFSPDSRWLIVATMDSSIKTWDIPTGRLIDWFLLSSICVTLTMSPTGEYLATAHSGEIGVYLWSNITLYSNVSLQPLPPDYEPYVIDLPTTASGSEKSSEGIVETSENSDDMEYKSPEQISNELVTLSLLPQSNWLNLLNLDIIKLHNKPKEPVKVPKNAPFFLPVVSGLKPTFLINEKNQDWENEKGKSQICHVMKQGSSEFFNLLKNSYEAQSYASIIEYLKKYTPANIDVELRLLSPENGGSLHLMKCFLIAMYENMTTKKNFELIHSYLALFFQIHADIIAEDENLLTVCQKIYDIKAWNNLEEKMNFILCLGNFTRSCIL